jgi:hypothetical protein
MKSCPRILGWGLLTILLWIISFSLDSVRAQESNTKPEVWIEIKELKASKNADQDVIEVIGSSNLPAGTILEMTLTSEIISLEASVPREEIISSKYVEIGVQKRFDGLLSDFARLLPPGIYTVKLSVAERQVEKIKKALPPVTLGATITQQKLFIGDIQELINYTQEKYQQLKKTIEFLTLVSNDLAKWVDLYNGLATKEEFRKKYRDEFIAWQVSISSQMNQALEQAATYTVRSLPYLYRATNLEIIMIGRTLTDQEGIFADLVTEKEHLIASNDPQRTQPPKTEIPKQASIKIKDFLTKDTIFSMFLIARCQAEAADLTYERLKTKTEKKDEWTKYQSKYQAVVTKLAEYRNNFQSSLGKEEKEFFKPVLTLLAEYETLLNQKIEALTQLVEGPEKTEEIEKLNKAITETRKKMVELFDQLKDKLLEQPQPSPPK